MNGEEVFVAPSGLKGKKKRCDIHVLHWDCMDEHKARNRTVNGLLFPCTHLGWEQVITACARPSLVNFAKTVVALSDAGLPHKRKTTPVPR